MRIIIAGFVTAAIEARPDVQCGFAAAYVYALRDEAKRAREMYPGYSDELLAGGGC
jgi:hypothetical protein